MWIIEYIETQSDIDPERIAYFATSSNAAAGPIYLAVEDRFRLEILSNGGLPRKEGLPSCDRFPFAPRVNVPVLMLNGKNDFIFPPHDSQRPLVDFLGTSPENTQHILYPGRHGLMSHFIRQFRDDFLHWLNRYFGKPLP